MMQVKIALQRNIFLRCFLIFLWSAALATVTLSDTSVSAAAPSFSQKYYVNGKLTDKIGDELSSDVKSVQACSETSLRYTDHAQGFSFCYPKELQPDISLSAVQTRLLSQDTQIEVYYDNFIVSNSNTRDYTYYGNRFINGHAPHRVETDERFSTGIFAVHRLKWIRPALSRIPNDRNYYASLEIVKNSQEAYTLLIKSSKPIDFDLEVLRSFELTDRQGLPGIYRTHKPSQTRMNTETRAAFNQLFSSGAPLRWGLFDTDAPERLKPIQRMEEKLGYRFPVVLRYQTFDENLPVAGLETARKDGKIVELTFQTVHASGINALYAGSEQSNQSVVYDLLDGRYDIYLRNYAAQLKSYGHPILFRLNNEMNGDWCWYSAFYTSKDAELYQIAWRYIHKLFDEAGVDNLVWVWNPHDLSRPDFKWNHPLAYYPGDAYVDVIGLTGYNTGNYFYGESWRDFDEIYKPLYADYEDWFDKPFMISEFGSNSFGGNKPAWIARMFADFPRYPKIKVAVWWSSIDLDSKGRPGRIYLLDENESTLAAFRQGLK